MLLIKDTRTRFGLISVLLHWYIAATILFLLLSGSGIHFLPVHGPLRPLRQSLTWWHMSFAVTAASFRFCIASVGASMPTRQAADSHPALAAEADCGCRLGAASDRHDLANHHRTEPSIDASRRRAMVWHDRDSGEAMDGRQLVGIPPPDSFHRRYDHRRPGMFARRWRSQTSADQS